MKLYIAVLDEVPDFMTPTLVAHAVLGAHLVHSGKDSYDAWLKHSFKKCVVRVNRKEFEKISALPDVYLGHENKTLNGEKSCAVPVPCENEDLPKVLRFAKLWKPMVIESSPVRQGYISPELLTKLQEYSASLDHTKINEFLELYRNSSSQDTTK